MIKSNHLLSSSLSPFYWACVLENYSICCRELDHRALVYLEIKIFSGDYNYYENRYMSSYRHEKSSE